MRRTITETADRLRPGDRIQDPDGKWMLISDITYATTDGILGALAVLLVNPAMAGACDARLLLLGPGFTLDIRRGPGYIPRPYPAAERTKIRRCGLGFEVWDTAGLEWVYVRPGQWRDEFGGAMEATELKLNALCAATPSGDPEVDRIVTALRNSTYQRTAEHVLNSTREAVDTAVNLGLVRVVKTQQTTYNRRGERMLAATR